jgi:hypothetical protein
MGVLFALPAVAADETPGLRAQFTRGALTTLADTQGTTLFQGTSEDFRAGAHTLAGDYWVTDARDGAAGTGLPDSEQTLTPSGAPEGARIEQGYAFDAASGELVVSQRATSPAPGLWGVEWSVGGIPLDMNIIVPAFSGLRLTRNSPGAEMSFDYPMLWEAGLVIVEGANGGFYVWAEDPKPGYKRLAVKRSSDGWRLSFVTMANAPFDDKREVGPLRWRVGAYTGDWRVPARRYRDWMEKTFAPIPVERQQPAWVRDIRACVIMPLDLPTLEALPLRLDPKQTLLYAYDWRKAGYDRDYPTYDQPVDRLDPFVTRAHALGFRVMLHCNYFGCDPLNPLYAQFEPYQVRSPWGAHEPEWWYWGDADPPIKFAYINPACKAWRDVLVERYAKLCREHAIDALHLDQTLCIDNDHNGLVEGMTMIEGSVALHRDLRAALPDIALSGEGLDEVTCRMEAFAQRHVFGMDHTKGTFSVEKLHMTHPISSYLLGPYTIIYGYLGCAAPTSGQIYGAWQEAYRNYAVIPTLVPSVQALRQPTGFSAQFFDEVGFWQDKGVRPDPDGEWSADTAFPLRTADGVPARYTTDRRLVCEDRDVIRTLYGMRAVEGGGTVDGWQAHDGAQTLNLDPAAWYPYRGGAPDKTAFHVASAFPPGFAVESAACRGAIAFARSRTGGDINLRIGDLMPDAVCGTKSFDGAIAEGRGELHAANGGRFEGIGDHLSAHPPYIGTGGSAYMRVPITLPGDAERFIAMVALNTGGEGTDRSDGVNFGVTVTADEGESSAAVLNATCTQQPLVLDVREFAGKKVELTLSIDPGPNKNPAYDWAEWFNPRIERRAEAEADITLVPGPGPWSVALSAVGECPVPPAAERVSIPARFPGAVYLLRERPAAAALPVDLTAAPREVFYVVNGTVTEPANVPPLTVGENSVGGVKRPGLFAHPPNQGRTEIMLPLTLPGAPAVFHAWVGLRDGAEKSKGATFRVEVNGVELAQARALAGPWQELRADLGPWAGKTAVLALITDADGDFGYDWACWGEPGVMVP